MPVNVLSVFLSLARSQGALQRSSSFSISKASCENGETWLTCPFSMCISSLKTGIYCLPMLFSHLFHLKKHQGKEQQQREENKGTELLLSQFRATESYLLGLWNIYHEPREAVLGHRKLYWSWHTWKCWMLSSFCFVLTENQTPLTGGWFQDCSAHVAGWVIEQPECETMGGSCSSTVFCSWQLSLCLIHFKTILIEERRKKFSFGERKIRSINCGCQLCHEAASSFLHSPFCCHCFCASQLPFLT